MRTQVQDVDSASVARDRAAERLTVASRRLLDAFTLPGGLALESPLGLARAARGVANDIYRLNAATNAIRSIERALRHLEPSVSTDVEVSP